MSSNGLEEFVTRMEEAGRNEHGKDLQVDIRPLAWQAYITAGMILLRSSEPGRL